MKQEKIMIVEKNDFAIKNLLQDSDYEIITARTFDEVINNISCQNPSLIIGDFTEIGRPVADVCKILRDDVLGSHIPLILVSDQVSLDDKIAATRNGASDYLIKPIGKEEVIARIDRSIFDMKRALNANPLTRLPGNIIIHEKLDKLLCFNETFTVAYFDVDHFKSYNDLYGYSAGDKLIRLTASLIFRTFDELSIKRDAYFVGHIGGDDFIMICSPDVIEKFCEKYVYLFDRETAKEYDEETRTRGFILGRDRRGLAAVFPLVSVSIAVVVNTENSTFEHVGEIASKGAEIKKYLKSLPGSSYLIDRRG